MILLAAALAAAPLAAPAQGRGGEAEQRTWTLFAERAWTGAGEAVENATITVRDGKIAAIRGGTRAPGDDDDALRAAAVTPGLIDLSARIERGFLSVEQSSEITPGVRVSDGLDPFDPAWARAARRGVTSVLVSPPDFNVIGGLGVALKTAGAEGAPLRARVLADELVLRAAIGSQPSQRNHPAFGRPEDFYSRRPTTRMGVEWELRRVFYAAANAGGSQADGNGGEPAGAEQLRAVLQGKLPMMVQAWTTQDIRTAVFLKEEIEREGLGRPRMILDAAAEAWKEPQLLTRSGVSVVLPPFPLQGRTGDRAFMAWDTAAVLHSLGVPIALSSHGSAAPGEDLAAQAGFAIRGGLSFEAALAAVTTSPARMLGLEGRIGSLESGKDADLVLWSGRPFEPTSRVIGVLIDGRLVLDPRARPEPAQPK
jgi:imidazolonepropionase-like amidohydrolase